MEYGARPLNEIFINKYRYTAQSNRVKICFYTFSLKYVISALSVVSIPYASLFQKGRIFATISRSPTYNPPPSKQPPHP